MTATLLSLHSYPVKSCAALNHEQVRISQSGLFLDRHWVVVSESGTFLTQRSHPRMALIQPALQQHDLTLSAPGMPPLHVPWLTDTDTPDAIPVRIWSSNTLGFDEGPEAAHWLSGFLETPCRLLRVHPTAERLASLPQPVFAAGAGALLRDGGFRADVSAHEAEALRIIARERYLHWMQGA